MKLLFDQNISFRILAQLSPGFSSSTHVKSAGLQNSTDKEIRDYAKVNGFVIVSQDSDFNDLMNLYGFPPKIIWIRMGNLRTKELCSVLEGHIEELQQFVQNESLGCFEIVKIR